MKNETAAGNCPGGKYTGCPRRGGQGTQHGKCERCGFDFDQEHLTPASVDAARETARGEIARKEESEREEALEKKRGAYRKEWEKAKVGRNIAGLRALLDRAVGDELQNIKAEHQKGAQALLDEWQDDADWAEANKAGRTQPEGWKSYLASHPQGRHAGEAGGRLNHHVNGPSHSPAETSSNRGNNISDALSPKGMFILALLFYGGVFYIAPLHLAWTRDAVTWWGVLISLASIYFAAKISSSGNKIAVDDSMPIALGGLAWLQLIYILNNGDINSAGVKFWLYIVGCSGLIGWQLYTGARYLMRR